MQERINWVYTLKTIGILAVILGHINSPFSNFIFSWHMPLFFIMSGFFINLETPYKIFLKKNFTRLMVPYFVFSFIGLIIEAIKRTALHRESLNYIQELKGILLGMDMESLKNHYGFVLWFLPALFFSRQILFFINKLTKNIMHQHFFISILFLVSFYITLPFAIDNSFNVLLWIYFGRVFYKNIKTNPYVNFLPVLLISILIFYHIPHLDVASKNYGNKILNLIWASSFTGTLILILKKTKYTKPLSNIFSTWGNETMIIFIIHPYTNNIAHILIEKYQWGSWLSKLIISLALMHFVLVIKKKYNNIGLFKYV